MAADRTWNAFDRSAAGRCRRSGVLCDRCYERMPLEDRIGVDHHGKNVYFPRTDDPSGQRRGYILDANYEIDHRIPLRFGGAHEPSNWVAVLRSFHQVKSVIKKCSEGPFLLAGRCTRV